jgi:hypothetical protein
MSIVVIWTLKDGPQTPPKPLDEVHSAWILQRWWEQDHPELLSHVSYWGTLRRQLPTASGYPE